MLKQIQTLKVGTTITLSGYAARTKAPVNWQVVKTLHPWGESFWQCKRTNRPISVRSENSEGFINVRRDSSTRRIGFVALVKVVEVA